MSRLSGSAGHTAKKAEKQRKNSTQDSTKGKIKNFKLD